MADFQLPPALASDERFALLCELLQEEMANLDINAMLVYLIDVVPDQVLPHLAEQFHVAGLEGWRFTRTPQERRTLIKHAVELHRFKGTPWAIEQVLVTLNLSGRVTEWFEYGGTPYHFRVEVELSDRGMDEATFNALVALITEYKNVRSRLELLTISLANRSQVPAVASVVLSGELTTIYPLQVTELSLETPTPRVGIGHWSVETVWLYPQPA
ncbi:phage tail protein I [Metapseudomonas otitidis]|uniref:phage tail protein I n=1 Tax=Metapseudomonas otitidis TaxID=319939 RepID=UPI0013F65E65|nr:phage tail protein I [Pseudomonas otitidis]